MRTRELRAIWHKCWLETKWGFLMALAVVLTFSLWSVMRFPEAVNAGRRDLALHHHANAALRGVGAYAQVEIFEKLTVLWSILAVMLGTGGLLKEKRLGTAPFLLSLPVTRRFLVAVRTAVAIAQAMCLAVAGYAAVPLAFPLVHQSYPPAAAVRDALLLAAGGMVFVIFGILISVLLEGSVWPALIGATTVFLLLIAGQLLKNPADYSPFVPWTGLSISVMAASLILGFTLWFVKWRDF